MTSHAFRLAEWPAGPLLRRHSAVRLVSLLCGDLGLATLLAAISFVGAAAAQTSGSSQAQPRAPITELACPLGTQILVLLQSASAPVYVTVDEVATTGQKGAARLDARTMAPQDMPSTLDLTQTIGEKDVFVSVRDGPPDIDYPTNFQSHLEGYIGCGGWQMRVLGGQPNNFLLKRAASAQPAPQTGEPTARSPSPHSVPAPAPKSTPGARSRNDQRADRGGAPDNRGGEERDPQTPPPDSIPAPRPNGAPAPPPWRNDQRADRGGAPDNQRGEKREPQTPPPDSIPAPRPNGAPAPPPWRNDQRADRGGAPDNRGGEEGDRQRIASELRSLGLLGTWGFSCDDRRRVFRDIFIDQTGRSFFRVYRADRARSTREIIGFQRLSPNRFQLTQRGRFGNQENAIGRTRFHLENNQLFVDDVRTASGHVFVERGRNTSGRFQGQSVPGFIKCRGPRAGATGSPSIAHMLTREKLRERGADVAARERYVSCRVLVGPERCGNLASAERKHSSRSALATLASRSSGRGGHLLYTPKVLCQ
jgi:hypothetical protein